VVRSRLRSVSEIVGPDRRQTRRNECSLSLRQLRHSIRMSALSDFLTHVNRPVVGCSGGCNSRYRAGWLELVRVYEALCSDTASGTGP